MSRFYILLISFLIFPQAQAEEVENINFNVSGYISTTVFDNSDWFANTVTAAINTNIYYKDWTIRAQLIDPYPQPITRLVVEKSFWITKGQELVVQSGRFPRLNSFYSNATDAPGTYNTAMLPLGEYNRRLMGDGILNSLDGLQIVYSIKSLSDHFKILADYGRAVTVDRCSAQIESVKITCNSQNNLKSQFDNYDVGFSFDHKSWSGYAYTSRLYASAAVVTLNTGSWGIANKEDQVIYAANKFGLKYSSGGWWLRTGSTYGNLMITQPINRRGSIQQTRSDFIIVGRHLTDSFSAYVSYSQKKSSTKNNNAADSTVGVSYTCDNVFMSIERHSGYGKTWEQYSAVNKNWDSLVISVTKRF